MITRRLRVWAALSFALVAFRVASAGTPEVGQKAPEFTLSTPDGHPLKLSEFSAKGTVVLVVLRGFPGYQCPYCQKQVHDFLGYKEKFAAVGVEVLFVYPGPPADLDQRAKEVLAKENPLPGDFQLVVDPDYLFTNLYGLRWDAPHETAYPSTFLIDRQGVVVFRKISREHGDRATAADILSELEHEGTPHSN